MSTSLAYADPPATRNRAFLSAWWKGWYAGLSGAAIEECPYPDKRAGNHGQIVTYSRAFRAYWIAGRLAGLNRREGSRGLR